MHLGTYREESKKMKIELRRRQVTRNFINRNLVILGVIVKKPL